MLETAAQLRPELVVYHCVDDLRAIPGVDRVAFEKAESRLLKRADHIFATSRYLHEHCSAVAPGRTYYFPNVAHIDHFAAARQAGSIPPELAKIPRPRLGYVGVLSDFKIDFALLEGIVTSRPEWHMVFIGDLREGQSSGSIARLRRCTNVHFLGWRPYASLPDYLRGIDVALLPQRLNEYTRAMFPMKFFEYLAAGKPLVATPLPSLTEFAGLYAVASDAKEFVSCIEALLQAPGCGILPSDHPVLRAHSWSARLQKMLAVLSRGIAATHIPESSSADRGESSL